MKSTIEIAQVAVRSVTRRHSEWMSIVRAAAAADSRLCTVICAQHLWLATCSLYSSAASVLCCRTADWTVPGWNDRHRLRLSSCAWNPSYSCKQRQNHINHRSNHHFHTTLHYCWQQTNFYKNQQLLQDSLSLSHCHCHCLCLSLSLSLSPQYNGHLFTRYQNISLLDFIEAWLIGVELTTGVIRRAKLQSNHHQQQTSIRLLTCRICPQCQPTVSKHWREMYQAICEICLLTQSKLVQFPKWHKRQNKRVLCVVCVYVQLTVKTPADVVVHLAWQSDTAQTTCFYRHRQENVLHTTVQTTSSSPDTDKGMSHTPYRQRVVQTETRECPTHRTDNE